MAQGCVVHEKAETTVEVEAIDVVLKIVVCA
jgi:hypothetical protein